MEVFFQWLLSIVDELKIWIIVKPWERTIRTRWGRFTRLLEPGVHWKIPVIDSAHVFNTRLRTYSFPSQTMETMDRKSVTVAGIVGYRIADPLAAHMAMKEPDTAVASLAQKCVAEYVTTHTYHEIRVDEMNAWVEAELTSMTDGLMFEFVAVTEFGAFRTLRLLQENWRPYTGVDD